MARLTDPEFPNAEWQGDTVIYRPVWGLTYAITRDAVEILEHEASVPQRLDFALQNGALYGYQEHLNHRLPLHASGFVYEGRAFAICGFSGWGKSTTAAHVRALGPGFLTDDILSVEDVDGKPVARAGPPKARLWPDAAHKVGLDPDALNTVYDDVEKRFVDIQPVVPAAPLAGLYILRRAGTKVSLAPLKPLEAITQLAIHTYSVKLLEQRPEQWHLELCSLIASSTPVKRLEIPQGLEHVDVAAHLVLEDMQRVLDD